MEVEKNRILLVEDDLNLGRLLKNYLELNNLEVELCRDGAVGLDTFKYNRFDLCILDIMMPNMDGFMLAEQIRAINPSVPLFFLSARNMKQDIINGYKLGADDFITKPFDSEVLLLKIQAILKRNIEIVEKPIATFVDYQLAKFSFNSKLRLLTIDDQKIKLSPKENALLHMLCENKNDLLTREQALKKIWGSDTYFNGRSMDVYIAKLRKYLQADPAVSIINIHGNGFRLLITE